MVVEVVVGIIIIDVPVTVVNHWMRGKVVLGVLGLDHVGLEVILVIGEGEGGTGIEAGVIAGVEVGVAAGVQEVTDLIVVVVGAILHLVGVVEAEVQRVVENLVIAPEIVNVGIPIHHNLTME